jgi:hypothetical protein
MQDSTLGTQQWGGLVQKSLFTSHGTVELYHHTADYTSKSIGSIPPYTSAGGTTGASASGDVTFYFLQWGSLRMTNSSTAVVTLPTVVDMAWGATAIIAADGSGAVTLTPATGDRINGGTVSAAITISAGQTAIIVADNQPSGRKNWLVFKFTSA